VEQGFQPGDGEPSPEPPPLATKLADAPGPTASVRCSDAACSDRPGDAANQIALILVRQNESRWAGGVQAATCGLRIGQKIRHRARPPLRRMALGAADRGRKMVSAQSNGLKPRSKEAAEKRRGPGIPPPEMHCFSVVASAVAPSTNSPGVR